MHENANFTSIPENVSNFAEQDDRGQLLYQNITKSIEEGQDFPTMFQTFMQTVVSKVNEYREFKACWKLIQHVFIN